MEKFKNKTQEELFIIQKYYNWLDVLPYDELKFHIAKLIHNYSPLINDSNPLTLYCCTSDIDYIDKIKYLEDNLETSEDFMNFREDILTHKDKDIFYKLTDAIDVLLMKFYNE